MKENTVFRTDDGSVVRRNDGAVIRMDDGTVVCTDDGTVFLTDDETVVRTVNHVGAGEYGVRTVTVDCGSTNKYPRRTFRQNAARSVKTDTLHGGFGGRGDLYTLHDYDDCGDSAD